MSTILNTEGKNLQIPTPVNPELRVAIVTAQWNNRITHALRDGAIEVLNSAGVKSVSSYAVPGTVELVNAAAALMRRNLCDAVIVIGCVIRGDTPHFDYVCQGVTQGVAILNAKGEQPVIFGVLTVDTEQQALDRAGGCLGNKGSEAAVAAIEMANFHSL